MSIIKWLSIGSLFLLSSCDFISAEQTFSCKGEIVESHRGTATNSSDYTMADSVSVRVSKSFVKLKGPSELKLAQVFDKEDNSHIGYEFTVCSKDKEFVYFNNYNCKESNKYPTFEVYEGEFNSVTKKLVLQTRNATPMKEISISQKATYTCNKSN